jgi:hypothetical protein
MSNRRRYSLDSSALKEITSYVREELDIAEGEQKISRQRKQQANIRIALRRYRELKAHAECSVYDAFDAEEETTYNDLILMMEGRGRESFKVESIMESAALACVCVNHIEKMLEAYRVLCENSGRMDKKRRYRVLKAMHFDGEDKTAEEIADAENVCRSTIYADLEKAYESMKVLFFGLHGLEL